MQDSHRDDSREGKNDEVGDECSNKGSENTTEKQGSKEVGWQIHDAVCDHASKVDHSSRCR